MGKKFVINILQSANSSTYYRFSALEKKNIFADAHLHTSLAFLHKENVYKGVQDLKLKNKTTYNYGTNR